MEIIDEALTNGTLSELPDEQVGTYSPGQVKCRRGYRSVCRCSLANDIAQGGNFNTVEFTRSYFDGAGVPLTNGLVGETAESITVFNKIRDLAYRAINNLLYDKDLEILYDPTTYGGTALVNCMMQTMQMVTTRISTTVLMSVLHCNPDEHIATVAIAAGNLSNVNALSKQIGYGTFVDGETIRTIKLGYQDKSTGLFVQNDQIRGVTSGAICEADRCSILVWKWIFAGPITGTFQYGELLTNSTLANQGNCTQSVITKKPELSGTKSIKIPQAGYLVTSDSYDYEFGATDDFTIEGWWYPIAVSVPHKHW